MGGIVSQRGQTQSRGRSYGLPAIAVLGIDHRRPGSALLFDKRFVPIVTDSCRPRYAPGPRFHTRFAISLTRAWSSEHQIATTATSCRTGLLHRRELTSLAIHPGLLNTGSPSSKNTPSRSNDDRR
jgi:hypothetical protein